MDQRRALAAQFQDHGRQVSGGGGHHQPTHPRPAGVEDEVEPLFQKTRRAVRVPLDDLDSLRVEIAGQELRQQISRGRRLLGGFDDRGAPGAKRTDQGRQGQEEGVVPGPHDQGHAARLRHDPGRAREQR